MSTMKKIGALILALAMCFALAMPAFADNTTPPTTGSITITNAKKVVDTPTQNDVTNSYTAYKIFAATPYGGSSDQDGPTATTQGQVVYTATPDQVTYWENKNLFVFTKGTADDSVVTLKNGVDAKDVAEYFNALSEADISKMVGDHVLSAGVALDYDDASKTAAKTGLDFGYYFISSNNGSVVSIDTTNFDVKIEDKNTYKGTGFNPGDGENPDGSLKDVYAVNGIRSYEDNDTGSKPIDVMIGDVVTYQVSSGTTNYVTKNEAGELDPDGKHSEKVQFVYINDKLESGLDYNKNMTVKVGNETLTASDSSIVEQGSTKQYFVKYSDEGNAFTVVIPWLDENGDPAFTSGSVVTVQYEAVVNDKIGVVDTEGNPADNAANKATLTIDSTPNLDSDPDDPGTDPDDPTPPTPDPENPGEGGHDTGVSEDTVKVYTYGTAIKKVDGKDASKVLAGAHFTLSKSTATNTSLKFSKHDDGTYYYDKSGSDDLVTNDKGQLVVRGLNNGTYVLTETAAPTGYNLMQDSTEIATVEAGETKATTTVTTTVYYKDEAKTEVADTNTTTEYYETQNTFAVAETEVQNFTGAELPSTGGIGTTIFYVVGGAMVIGAGVLLITKKRMAE